MVRIVIAAMLVAMLGGCAYDARNNENFWRTQETAVKPGGV